MNSGFLDHLIFHIASGQAFFLGSGLILLGLLLSVTVNSKGILVLRDLGVILGGILVSISATPLPLWFFGVLGCVSLSWLVLEWLKAKVAKRWLASFRLALLASWLTAIAVELPYHLMPTVPSLGRPDLYLIGDSVSAGTGDKAVTWPQLLSRQHSITVHDLSQMGATVASAMKQASRLQDKNGLVLLEIGGNDLLGSTTAAKFEAGLEKLLAAVCRPGRTVVMFELPLLPFANDYGSHQRNLAHQFGVLLLPKRIFLRVLTTSGATEDGVHLTPAGHQLMADTVWDLLRSAYDTGRP
jgi:acyl-CoA thioesterase-1